MKLIIKTPFFEKSDFMAHIIEHCVINQKAQEQSGNGLFWALTTSGSLSGEYTTYTFDPIDTPQIFFDYLTRPIHQETIQYEYDIFTEEFGSIGYVVRAFEKLFRTIYDPQRTGGVQYYDHATIQRYHQNYYTKDNYVIYNFDHDHTLIYTKQIYPCSDLTIPIIDVHHILLEGETNIFLTIPNTVGGLLFAQWLELLIDSYDKHEKRYRLGSYYTHQTTRRATSLHTIIRIGPHTRFYVSQKFYDTMLTLLPHYLAHHFFLQTRAICILTHQCCPDYKTIADFLTAIPYQTLSSLLDQCDIRHH